MLFCCLQFPAPLLYLDINNLYKWTMIQKLAIHGFAWEKVDNFTSEKIKELVKADKKC